jgi:hypothetical protein
MLKSEYLQDLKDSNGNFNKLAEKWAQILIDLFHEENEKLYDEEVYKMEDAFDEFEFPSDEIKTEFIQDLCNLIMLA